MTVSSWLARVLDRVTDSRTTRWAGNRVLEGRGYGTLLDLRLDPKARTLEAKVLLRGEVEPLDLRLGYTLGDSGGPTLRVDAFSCSRPWMEALARDLAVGREFPLPPRAAALLRDLLG